tara:strand:- start:512 stop:733 length:222 start_codon:yes stop_codon:yes gene_type:complete
MKQYIIIDVSELDNLNFDELATTSKETARRSLDGTKAIVSFYKTPDYFAFATTYTNEELLELINNTDWNEEEE